MHIPALVEHLESRTMLAGDLSAEFAAVLSGGSVNDVAAFDTAFGEADRDFEHQAEQQQHSLPTPNQQEPGDFHLLTCTCPICLATYSATTDEAGAAGGAETPPLGSLPLSETFKLHSNPGAKHTIYLDFDGHTTADTLWNIFYSGGASITSTAYSFEGGSGFSTAELQRIQSIWARVAEDFAPFNVNVTTEDPGAAALTKSGGSDDEWGVRVVVGGNHSWYGSAGGVAFVGSFTWDTDTPVYVFEDLLGNGNEKYTAEAITHEAGHALGLSHDGTATSSYYSGNGTWAPIMGTGYYAPVTQWSKGEYAGANNTEDDLAIIVSQNGFGYRADDFGNTISTATPLNNQSGIISTRTDRDVFSFSTGGSVDITVSPDAFGPNLNILAEILDASGNVVYSADSSELGASISTVLAPGNYYLRIDGVGDAAGGYSDYGSLGNYSIQATIEDPAPPPPGPSEPPGLAVNKNSVVVNESGTTETFTVVLKSKPTANVTVTLRTNDGSEGKLDKTSLTFTPTNWNVAQTVTAIGVDDTLYDGDRKFLIKMKASSTDSNYNLSESASPVVSGTTIDNEGTGGSGGPDGSGTPALAVNKVGMSVNESGTTESFTVVLQSKPTANVTVTLRTNDGSEGKLDKTVLTFTPTNWNVAQTVKLIGVDDALLDGDRKYCIKIKTSSTDANYNISESTNPYISATTIDNEGTGGSGGGTEDSGTPGIAVSTSGLTVSESGTSDAFTVVLQSKPTANVSVTLRTNDGSEGVLDKTVLTFTPTNWNVAQTVTLTGVDDSLTDGDRKYMLKIKSSSADTDYNLGESANPVITCTTTDNEGGEIGTPLVDSSEPVIDPMMFEFPDSLPTTAGRPSMEVDIDRFFEELPTEKLYARDEIAWSLEQDLAATV